MNKIINKIKLFFTKKKDDTPINWDHSSVIEQLAKWEIKSKNE
jgi:hypothetical protein